jgi:uncharacterized HAD superfamily protein
MNTIAIDIDDTLNNYSEILHTTNFAFDENYNISRDTFDRYLEMIKNEKADRGDLLSAGFSFLRQKINGECYQSAVARPDAVEFMQWLRRKGWRIVICTHRDLRRTEEITRKWMRDNRIPFDYLFIAVDKLKFCKKWGIDYLVDDHLFSVRFADQYGVEVFFPTMAKHEGEGVRHSSLARGFTSFNEVRLWI